MFKSSDKRIKEKPVLYHLIIKQNLLTFVNKLTVKLKYSI